MKNQYMLFVKEDPKDTKTVRSLIRHFCMERELKYRFPRKYSDSSMDINGNPYSVDVRGCEDAPGMKYWMITLQQQV